MNRKQFLKTLVISINTSLAYIVALGHPNPNTKSYIVDKKLIPIYNSKKEFHGFLKI